MRKHVRRVLATTNVAGNTEYLNRLTEVVDSADIDAVALIGNLADPNTQDKVAQYKAIFKIAGHFHVPVFYIPGAKDVPLYQYLREAYNIELVFPMLKGVHGKVAFGPGHIAFVGMGGHILDDEHVTPEEHEELRYPGWMVEYELKILNELKDYVKVFLFSTPPSHKGMNRDGSTTLEELIKTFAPVAAIVDDKEFYHEFLGTTLVVSPGKLAEGDYAVVDLRRRKVETGDVR